MMMQSYLRKYDEDDVAWEAARDRKKIGRVREVLDKKGVSDSLKEMFRNYWEVLVELFKQDPDNESNRQPGNSIKNNIRRIKISRINKKEISPEMHYRILGKVGNRKEVFIADTGTSVLVCPIKKNTMNGTELDLDKPKYSGVTGTDRDIIDQAVIKVSFTTLKNPKQLKVLVCKQQADELLVDLDSLIEWSIVPADFPLLQNPKERPESISKFLFRKMNKDTFDMDSNINKMRKQLLSTFQDVFKKVFITNIEQVKVQLVEDP